MAWFAVSAASAATLGLATVISKREEDKDNNTIKAIESGTELMIELQHELKNTLFIFDNDDILFSISSADAQCRENLAKVFKKIVELEVSFPLHEFIIKQEIKINNTFEYYIKIINTKYNEITELIYDKYTAIFSELVHKKEEIYKKVNIWYSNNTKDTLTFAGDSYVKKQKIDINNKIKAKFDEQEINLKNIKESLINRLKDVINKIKDDYAKDKIIMINLLKHKAIDHAEKSTTFINLFKNAADLLEKEKKKEFILNMISNYKLL